MHVFHDQSVFDDGADTSDHMHRKRLVHAVKGQHQKQLRDAAPAQVVHHHDKERGLHPGWEALRDFEIGA